MTYQTSVPVVKDSYASSGFGDDLAMAALWLGVAQNNSTMISQAQGYYSQFQLDDQLPDSVLNWDSTIPAIPILGTQIYKSYPQLGGNNWQSRAESYLDRVVSGKGAGKLTKGRHHHSTVTVKCHANTTTQVDCFTIKICQAWST